MGTVSACHPEREHVAKGLCANCYKRVWYRRPGNREKVLRRVVRYDDRDPARTKARKRDIHRRLTYGITQEDFDALLVEQDNKCAVCRNVFVDVPLIDHSHVTGVVRGLLCRRCNSGIGMLNDDPERIIAAYNYMRKHADGPE